MPIKSESFSVGVAAALLAAGGTNADPVRVTISAAAADIQLGGPDVTTANGLTFKSTDQPLSFVLGPKDDLYAVASGATTVRVLRTRG